MLLLHTLSGAIPAALRQGGLANAKSRSFSVSKERLLVLVLSVVKARAFLLLRSSPVLFIWRYFILGSPFPHRGSSQLRGLWGTPVSHPRRAVQGQAPGAAMFCCGSVLLAERPRLWEPPVSLGSITPRWHFQK